MEVCHASGDERKPWRTGEPDRRTQAQHAGNGKEKLAFGSVPGSGYGSTPPGGGVQLNAPLSV